MNISIFQLFWNTLKKKYPQILSGVEIDNEKMEVSQRAVIRFANVGMLFAVLFAPTLTNDTMSFCSSDRRNCQGLFRCWPNALSTTSLAYANRNLVQTISFQISRWSNQFKGTKYFQFFTKTLLPKLRVISYSILFQQPLC